MGAPARTNALRQAAPAPHGIVRYRVSSLTIPMWMLRGLSPVGRKSMHDM